MNQAELFRLYPERKHPKPPPAKLRLTPYEAPEADVLSSLLAALPFFKRVVWFHRMNTGAYAVGVGSDRRFIKYGFPGCPDILGMSETGKTIAIEVKRCSGRASEAQQAFLDRVNAHGGIGFVARSIDDLREHLA